MPLANTYIIYNVADPSLCLAAVPPIQNGAKVTLALCDTSGTDSAVNQWFEWGGDLDYYMSMGGVNWCLDADTNHSGDGGKVQIWTCNLTSSGVNQRWSWNGNSLPWALQNHWNGKCVDADANHIGVGDSIATWGCVKSKRNQQWNIKEAIY